MFVVVLCAFYFSVHLLKAASHMDGRKSLLAAADMTLDKEQRTFILYFKFAPRLFVQKRSNRQRYLWVELFSIWTHPVSWLLLIHVTTALSWAAQKYHLKLGWPRPPLSYSGSNLYSTKYNWWSYFIAVCHTNHLCCFSVFIYHKISDELIKTLFWRSQVSLLLLVFMFKWVQTSQVLRCGLQILIQIQV